MAKRTSRRIRQALKAGEKTYVSGEEDPPFDIQQKHKVTVMKDHLLQYPDLYIEVFIAGDKYEEVRFAEMFTRSRCTKAKSLAEADLCVFTGGPDVDPQLYGEAVHSKTRVDPKRDEADIATFEFCLERGIPMLGVCRGAQFLHVMNGGKLFQHVDNHYGTHSMVDLKTKNVIEKISSVHHQMVRTNQVGGMEIIGTTAKSRNRHINPNEMSTGMSVDIEAFFYRDTCCLGVQGHPEYRGFNAYTVWVLQQVEEYMMINPDVDWIGGNRRILPDLLEQRKLKWEKEGLLLKPELKKKKGSK